MSTFATDPASADNVERKKEVLERLEGNVAPDNLKIAHNLSFIVCRDTDNLCSWRKRSGANVGWREHFNFNFQHKHFFEQQLEMKTCER